MKVRVKSVSHVRLFATPCTIGYQASLSMVFPGKGTGVGCYFLLQGIFPIQESNPGFLHCRQIFTDWAMKETPKMWFRSPKNKASHCFHVSPSICHEVMGPDAMILVFWMLSFKPTFSLSTFTFIKRLFSSSSLSAVRVVSSAYLRLYYWYSSKPSWFHLVLHPTQHFAWCTLHIS